jgi:hypothetical protein
VVGDGAQPGFNDVYGDWNIQCINQAKSPSDSMDASWVGLGGFYDSNLWQAGSGWSSSLGYYLWYEAVGTHGTGDANGNDTEVYITGAHCGDHIFAEVWFAPNNTSSNVGYVIINKTANVTYRGYAPSGFSSGNLTGEWIDERPTCGSDQNGNIELYKLTDYNYSDWSNAYISPNNASAGYSPIGFYRSDSSRSCCSSMRFFMSQTPSGKDSAISSHTRILITCIPFS